MKHSNFTLSIQMLNEMLNNIQEKLFETPPKTTDLTNGFSVTYSVGYKLKNGEIELFEHNIMKIKHLDIIYEYIKISIAVKYKKTCITVPCEFLPFERKCITNPFGSKKYCAFEDNPTYTSREIDIAPLIRRSEITLKGDIEVTEKNNKLKIYFKPRPEEVDVDFIDIPDDLVDLWVDQIKKFAEDGLPGGDVKDAILKFLKSTDKLLRKIFDIGDNLQEWLQHKLSANLSITNMIVFYIILFFTKDFYLTDLDNPYPILCEETIEDADKKDFCLAESVTPIELIPVKIPLKEPEIVTNNKEITIGLIFGE